MAKVALNTRAIRDEPSFHAECKRALRLPDFYGANWDAWIDCLSSLREDDGMIGVRLAKGESLQLELPDVEELRRRAPGVVEDLVECTAAVNKRLAQPGSPTAIKLLLT